jgi:hypothetical protein
MFFMSFNYDNINALKAKNERSNKTFQQFLRRTTKGERGDKSGTGFITFILKQIRFTVWSGVAVVEEEFWVKRWRDWGEG